MITVKSFVTNYFSENTYLVYDESNEGILIDCGCLSQAEKNELKDFVDQEKITIKRYLCTHLHMDHIFGNEFVLETFGLYPEAHKVEVEGLPPINEQAKMFGFPFEIKPVKVEKFLVGGEIINFGHSELKVLFVPGHSPGGLAFYNEKNGYLFVGDSLFNGSIGRTDLWGGNQEVLLAAINDKLLSLPDETIVYPGHGPHTTIFEEKMSNPFL